MLINTTENNMIELTYVKDLWTVKITTDVKNVSLKHEIDTNNVNRYFACFNPDAYWFTITQVQYEALVLDINR